MKTIPLGVSRLHRLIIGYIFSGFMCLLGISTSALALTKEEIRTEAHQVMEKFETGEISETSATNQLDMIEKKAQLLHTSTTIVIPEIPKEIPKIETAVGTSLVRIATFPELSLWEKFWGVMRPVLLGMLAIAAILWFTIGYFGTQKLEIWSRKLQQIYQDKRNTFFPASRAPITEHGVPPFPSGNHFAHANRALRHSGEVPDSLT